MAIVSGDTVIPAGSFAGNARVADLSVGSLVPAGLVMGVFHGDADEYVVWNNGEVYGNAVNGANYRKCTAYTGAFSLGQTVRLTGKPVEFIGQVVQVFNTELDDSNGDGTQEPVVLVRANQFYYVAQDAALEEY